MKRVLVTGASGFLGQVLVPALLARGFEVHGVMRSAPAVRSAVTWHQADLLTEVGREHVLEASRPSHLVHLAWEARPSRYRDDPANLLWASSTFDLLDRALAGGVARILGVGSCFEYGSSSGPCGENSTACRPTTLYGEAKLGAARHFLAAAERGAGAVWGRVFFPFGPHEAEGRLIPSLIRSCLTGRTFDCSNGEQLRDFIYVEDLADAIVAVLDSELTGVVNLGSGEARSIRSVIEHFSARLGASELVRFGAVEATGVDAEPMIVADVSRLRRATAYAPRFGFEAGAERELSWWIERLRGQA
jgi:nucleoside-diphosphate-sugar epimerase